MAEIINMPPAEEFKKPGRLDLPELLETDDSEFDTEDGRYELDELKMAYYRRAQDSLRRSLGDLKALDVDVYINEKGRLVFKNSSDIAEEAAKNLFLHHLRTNRQRDIKDAKRDIDVKKVGKDGLTGLENKDSLEISFKREAEKAKEDKNFSGIGVLFFDIDNFKSFNDTFGQLAGDELIKMLAARVRSIVRSTDIVARYGGEEFVVVLSDIQESQLRSAAQKIHEATRLTFKGDGGQREVTTSMGVSYVSRDRLRKDGRRELLRNLIQESNKAEHYSKVTGKDRISFFRELPKSGESGILTFDEFKRDYYTRHSINRKLDDRRTELQNAMEDVVRNVLNENLKRMEKTIEEEVEIEYAAYLCRLYEETKKLPASADREEKVKELERLLASRVD